MVESGKYLHVGKGYYLGTVVEESSPTTVADCTYTVYIIQKKKKKVHM